jgi:4-carboxymuconolactone decarboxylase
MTELEATMAKGRSLAAQLFAGAPPKPGRTLPKKFEEYTFGHLFGTLWSGDDLAIEDRSLVTCVTLVALNRLAEQRLHFIAARNLGIPRAKLEAVIVQVAHYAGWPCAASALDVLNEVWPA